MRFARWLTLAGLSVVVVLVWAIVWQLFHPTGVPPVLEITATPVAAIVAVPQTNVSAMGTRFPTNIPHAQPKIVSPATPTPTPVSLGDTLITSTPTPVVSAAVEPVVAERVRFIQVNQDEQKMYIFENGRVVRELPISTGRPVTNAFTPPWQGTVGEDWGSGAFRGSGLYSDYMWFLFPGPEGSILIHSVPYQKNGMEKQYDRLDALGVEPISNGCVRISPDDAAWLKQWNPVGVPIEITRWSGKISSS